MMEIKKITKKKSNVIKKDFVNMGGKSPYEKYYFEAKQKSNTKFEKRTTLKKFLVTSGIFGIIIVSIVFINSL